MSKDIFKFVHESAERMGGCDPNWLHAEAEPDYITVEPKSSNGKELLLLHGLFGALSNWESTLPLFAQYSKPIALSFPLIKGHRSTVKIKALAAYTEYFIRKRGIGPVTLCGNSLGGHVALRLALARPELVDKLILSGSSGLYEHTVDSLPIRPDHRFVREHMQRVFYHQRFVTEEAVDEIAQILKSRTQTLNLIHAARSAKKDNLLPLLRQIKAPTLLLWGENDLVTSMDVAETFHKNIPNSKLVTVKGCGHAPMIEHPEWFSEQVREFLAK